MNRILKKTKKTRDLIIKVVSEGLHNYPCSDETVLLNEGNDLGGSFWNYSVQPISLLPDLLFVQF